jgi:hypothetical protein
MDPNGIRQAAVEAASAPTQFNARERSAYVRGMVARCEKYKEDGLSSETVKERLPGFAREYPKLFEAVMGNEQYHRQSLLTMLALLDHMGEGTLSQHQASVIVGERLVQTFVKPQIERQGQ